MPVEIKEVVIKVPNSDFRVDVVCQDLASELKLERGTATERLGTLFEITLSLYSDDLDVDLCAVLGKPMAIHISTGADERWFHGIVTHFAMTGMTDRFGYYTAILKPKLALMGEATTSRVFAKKSLAEVLQDSLNRSAVDVGGVTASPAVQLEHCVQYRESDLEFVSRLMERFGLFYWHRHEETKHTLEVTSGTTGLPDLGTFDHVFDGAGTSDHQISDWRFTKSLRASSYQVAGTEYLTTNGISEKKKTRFQIEAASELKIHDFEAVNETTEPHLVELATARMQAIDTTVEDYRGTTDSLAMAVGGLFTLAGHPRADQNKQYLCVAATYQFQGIKPDGTRDPGRPYLVQFSAIDSQTPFSPPIVHKKPVVQGPHLARVVEETDDNGRVLVAFHWGNPDEDLQSCRARVSQNWAGKEWGGVFLPHMGHEVIVEFLNGDPDQPIVTGRVYNSESMPPLALPGEKEKSIIRDHGGNEIMMDGAAKQIRIYCPGHESEIWLGKSVQISSDSNWINKFLGYEETDIKGKSTTTIGNDNHVTVKGNKQEHIIGKFLVKVGADVMETLLGAQHRNIVGMTSLFVGGMKKEHIVGAEWKRIDGIKREKVRGAVLKDAPKDVTTLREAYNQVKGLVFDKFDDWKQQIKGELFLKTAKKLEKAEEMQEAAKNVKQDFKTLRVTGESHEYAPSKEFRVNTKTVVLIFENKAELKGKLTVNDGALEVKE
ncbi:MAG: type VI secretion system tip protein VgrG [Planctomycetes bacterium]|nr:type VI secretion system tip protein VgrG [Planctomycetota bacterium]